MTPLPPDLRKALLTNKDHFRLTPALLDQYEASIAEFYYKKNRLIGDLVYIPEQSHGSAPIFVERNFDDLLSKIHTFRDTFMPNYADVVKAWADKQEKTILSSKSCAGDIRDLIPYFIYWVTAIWVFGIFDIARDDMIAQSTILVLFVLLLGWMNRKGKVIQFMKKLRLFSGKQTTTKP